MRILAVLLGLLLTACQTQPAPPPNQFPEISFRSAPPFRLTVSGVEVVREYVPPMAYPNVDHRFPVPPAAMAERWAADRLSPAGGAHRARYIVKQASVVEVQLPMKSGITGAFTTQQAYRFDAVLEVELHILNDRGFREGQVTARVEQHQTAAEDISQSDREKLWFAMTQALARDLDAELDKNIRAGLPRFIGF